MLGPLTGNSPGNRGVGRLRTCEVREIGRLEGPGSGRSAGLPPRTLFFTAESKTHGVRKCAGPQKLLCSDPIGILGTQLRSRTPFPAVFRFSEGSPPGTFGVFSDRRTRRVPRPLFPGDVEVGKSGDPAKGREEKENGSRGKKMTDARRKKNGRRRQPLHMTDVRAAGGRIPGEPGNW